MKKRNGHRSLYRGPAKPIPTGVKFHPIDYAEYAAYAVCLAIVLMDLFVWRP